MNGVNRCQWIKVVGFPGRDLELAQLARDLSERGETELWRMMVGTLLPSSSYPDTGDSYR